VRKIGSATSNGVLPQIPYPRQDLKDEVPLLLKSVAILFMIGLGGPDLPTMGGATVLTMETMMVCP
jgi:hypothetical protein